MKPSSLRTGTITQTKGCSGSGARSACGSVVVVTMLLPPRARVFDASTSL